MNKISFTLNPSKTSRKISFEIELTQVKGKSYNDPNETIEGLKLAIRGSYHKSSCCCQAIDEIKGYLPRVRKEDQDNVNFIIYLWENYHLNNCHPGTINQEKLLKENKLNNWANNYKACCEFLESKNLLIDNGYKFGSGWLFEPLPIELANKLNEIIKKRSA